MSPNAGEGGCGVSAMSTAVHMEPKRNFGDLSPYLTDNYRGKEKGCKKKGSNILAFRKQ